MNRQKSKHGFFTIISGVVLFFLMLGILLVATMQLSDTSEQQGVDAAYNAIQRAAVLCYATEGFYPPSLEYIKDKYGVQVDTASYVVHYNAIASNLMPEIYVFIKR